MDGKRVKVRKESEERKSLETTYGVSFSLDCESKARSAIKLSSGIKGTYILTLLRRLSGRDQLKVKGQRKMREESKGEEGEVKEGGALVLVI